MGGIQLAASNVILTNGQEDPWKWAGILKRNNTKLDQVAQEIKCADCAHCVELYTPSESDAPELKNARYLVT
jgi:hypothetical protein